MSVAPLRRPSPASPMEPLTEAGAAERFARLHGQDVRFDHRRGRWLLWSGHRWTPDTDGGITRFALTFVRQWQREAVELDDRDKREATIRVALRLERRDALRAMLALAQDLRPIADPGDGWDTDPLLLGVPNGVVHLRTGELREGRRDDRITLSTAVPYDPAARSGLWGQTLRAVLRDDDTIGFFHLAAGYSVTGDMRADCWFLTHGSGRNGKGTLLHPIRRALGDYAIELPAACFDARKDAVPYDLAALPGRRFVMSSEAGDTIRLHHDRIKQLTGGDPMRAANKYERSFEFQPTCKLWMSANRKPRVTDDTPAFWARVMTIPFPVSFVGREDRDLRPTLEHAAEHQTAILAWLVEGARRYLADGLRAPATIRTATEDYERESDPLAAFFEEALAYTPGSEIVAADLFHHYCAWARACGLSERERLTATAFGRRVGERFTSRRTNRGRVYQDIARRQP